MLFLKCAFSESFNTLAVDAFQEFRFRDLGLKLLHGGAGGIRPFLLKFIIQLGTEIHYLGCQHNECDKFFKTALVRTRLGLHKFTCSIDIQVCAKPHFNTDDLR